MEALILGWYVLTATGSVEWLVAFGSLMWVGAIVSPFLSIIGDRIGLRALLCITRGAYAVMAGLLTVLTLTETLEPWHVFVIYGLAGLARPSDQAIRNLLIGQTIAPHTLMGAMGLSRTTADLAKIAGALAGAGGVALIGMGPAYVIVTVLYASAFALSLGVARSPRHVSHVHDVLVKIAEAGRYVWTKPDLLGAFSIAFLVNLLAYPFFLGLLPYVAKEVFQVGQSGLGYLAATFAIGALAASLLLGANYFPMRAGRVMLVSAGLWFGAVLLFGLTRSFPIGLALIFLSGFVQSCCMIPIAVVMLRGSSEEMRARVMSMRIVAIWGLPLGLLASGPIIEHFGYTACVALYAILGLAATFYVGYRTRAALWHRAD
jgi:predicted MFS family arabinose efflux permease